MTGWVLWAYWHVVLGAMVPVGAFVWLGVTVAPLRRNAPRRGTADGVAILGLACAVAAFCSSWGAGYRWGEEWIVAPACMFVAVGLLLVLSRATRIRMGDGAAYDGPGSEDA